MPNYPLTNFHFRVDWGGSNAGFQEVSGLGSGSYEEVKYRDGISPESNDLKFPGRKTFTDINLKRGTFQGDNEFYEWWNQNDPGEPAQRDIVISLLNKDHEPVVVWKVLGAWVKEIKSTTLNADSNEVAVEEMVIAHQGCEIQND
ncbi:phage tail protein [Flavilitoribacter nigricans]|uniref:Phage tail protein n=1 Tax=Flavilitoribacter nigricans (strain ATCC 23147 / DSM 23189 / NBRC 102662 / NCIMB 1420 / SS-2) TaxID=1122177 RepID=A0A2D0MYC3_FLAN2|nr:phage tail protein [Flavilitoribacter nigricans]PHN01264.1 phage tail protein [Flavilitoribacter nigricans DSM 23189 = NBRC 102662]